MQLNDVIIRADRSEFIVTSAANDTLIVGPFETFHAALEAARRRVGAYAIWLQPLRQEGQPVEDPVRLPPRKHGKLGAAKVRTRLAT